jgi:predicted DNA binding protein
MEPAGLHVSMSVDPPDGCPAGEVSAETGSAVESITWNATAEDTVTEEFTTTASVDRPDTEPVFEADGRTRHRFQRQRDAGCVCEQVERHGYPLADVSAEDGRLYLRFYTPDVDAVRELVATLREDYENVTLEHLSQSGDLDGENLVLIDRNRLTDRQQEILETAYEEGYFEHPRETNASELAETLGISLSTFTEHLTTAQSKVFTALVDDT